MLQWLASFGRTPRHARAENAHVESELVRMAVKVDEMHAVLMQAKGVRWAIIAVSGLGAFLTGLSHWLIRRREPVEWQNASATTPSAMANGSGRACEISASSA